jgi:hypothetical protein
MFLLCLVSKNQNPPLFGTLRKADEPSIGICQQANIRVPNEEDWKEKDFYTKT